MLLREIGVVFNDRYYVILVFNDGKLIYCAYIDTF